MGGRAGGGGRDGGTGHSHCTGGPGAALGRSVARSWARWPAGRQAGRQAAAVGTAGWLRGCTTQNGAGPPEKRERESERERERRPSQPASQARRARPHPTRPEAASAGAGPTAETPEWRRKLPGAPEWPRLSPQRRGATRLLARPRPLATIRRRPGAKRGRRGRGGCVAAMVEEKGRSGGGGISEEEAAQYDRQIRLWGLEAQKRLRGSRALVAGLRGLGAEVAKNLALAGVKALTLLDHRQVSLEDARGQFLLPASSPGKNRAEASLERVQDLNPMVEVKADPENIEQKPEEFFTGFDVVCLTCCTQEVLLKVDQICKKHGIKFFTGDVFGYHGYMFANLGEHEFVEEKTKATKASQEGQGGSDAKKTKLDIAETTLVKKNAHFCLLKDALALSWSSEGAKAALKRTAPDYFLLQVLFKFRTEKGRDPAPLSYLEDAEALRQMRLGVLASLGVGTDLIADDFASCFSEMAPVCAVVGGVLSQEVVKALSQRDPPLNNFFFFDGVKGSGVVECLAPNLPS